MAFDAPVYWWGGPTRLRPADVDPDGDLDIVSVNAACDEVRWAENLGGGGFGGEIVIADTDGAALFDGDELVLGTDPLVSDTDGDGIFDVYEVALGPDPLVSDTEGTGCPTATRWRPGRTR